MSTIWTGRYWKAAAERALSAGAYAVILTGVGDGFDVLNADWPTILGAFGGAVLLSVLKGFIANATTNDGPGFTGAETLAVPQTPELHGFTIHNNPSEDEPGGFYRPQRAMTDDGKPI